MTRAEKKQHAEKMAALKAEAGRIVAAGVCPACGEPLRRNLALAGWWQCAALGADTHRDPKYAGRPSCHFQTFTE
jgi:hypothetical protein